MAELSSFYVMAFIKYKCMLRVLRIIVYLTYAHFSHFSDISPEVIDRSSILRDCRPLDLLVRTSGEVRLSNFMLWQASRAASTFSSLTVLWPALSFWHLVVALLQFQLNRAALLPLPEV